MPSRTTRIITLDGTEAAAFANAQFSSDILSLAPGHWQWSGWLDPKGRVRALLQVARPEADRLMVVLRGGDGLTVAADLQRFVFRTKVKVGVSGPLHVADGEPLPDGTIAMTGDALVLGEGDASLMIGGAHADDAWCARHIQRGYAWLPDEALDTLLPPALSMERLGAVAFSKGCFPGQEIAARLHFLGGHKKHLRIVRSATSLRDGDALRKGDRDIGIVLMHALTDEGPTSLVVLDDAAAQEDTLENGAERLHVLSTFEA